MKISAINHFGITGLSHSLEKSSYSPLKCLNETKRYLDFLGIYGSKWIANEKEREALKKLINHVKEGGREIRFLLLNENGNAAKNLDFKHKRDDFRPFNHYRDILETHGDSVFKIRLYDEKPKFRLVFIDGKIVTFSNYVRDKDVYVKKKYGYALPLPLLKKNSENSANCLASTLEDYFEELWVRSTPFPNK